ncbi:MAG: DUF3099 domain-containing protein [Mobilicoccus sp.]|nr:DUF3099 domain-containing protein [Mobilicoccus sp.]
MANAQVHSISTVPRSRAQDRAERTRNYVIAMTIRTVSFVLATVFATVLPWQPGVWICVAAAVLLPYPAVVYANRQDRRASTLDSEPVVPFMLGPAPGDSGAQAPTDPVRSEPPVEDVEPRREEPPTPQVKKKWWVG